MVNLDASQFLILGAIIVGVNELLVRLRAKDVWAVATILSAAVIGGIFGAIHYYPTVDIPTGIAIGFAACGSLKTLSVFGNKTIPTENTKVVN